MQTILDITRYAIHVAAAVDRDSDTSSRFGDPEQLMPRVGKSARA